MALKLRLVIDGKLVKMIRNMANNRGVQGKAPRLFILTFDEAMK